MKVMQHVDPTCFCGYNRFHPSILPNSQRSSSSAQLDIILCFTKQLSSVLLSYFQPLDFSIVGLSPCRGISDGEIELVFIKASIHLEFYLPSE